MYLPTLLEQKKWNAKKRNLRVGDVILIADENYPREGRGHLSESLKS